MLNDTMRLQRIPTSEPQPTWFGSMIGWLCLFLAAACYGTVHLAPRLLTMIKLEHRYETTQLRLVSLEGQLHDLGKMAEALESDRDLTQNLARIEFPTDQPGVQHIEVDPHLAQDPRAFNPRLDVPEPPWPWYTGLLRSIAENGRLNSILLASAAFCTLLAFIPLRFKTVRTISGKTVVYTTGVIGFLRNRYYRKP